MAFAMGPGACRRLCRRAGAALGRLWKGCLSSSRLLSEGGRALVAGSCGKGGIRMSFMESLHTVDGSETASPGRMWGLLWATTWGAWQQSIIKGTGPVLWERVMMRL